MTRVGIKMPEDEERGGNEEETGLDFVNLEQDRGKSKENPEFDVFKSEEYWKEAHDQAIEITNLHDEIEKLQNEKQSLETSLEGKVQELNSTVAAKDEQILQLGTETDAKIKDLETRIAEL